MVERETGIEQKGSGITLYGGSSSEKLAASKRYIACWLPWSSYAKAGNVQWTAAKTA